MTIKKRKKLALELCNDIADSNMNRITHNHRYKNIEDIPYFIWLVADLIDVGLRKK